MQTALILLAFPILPLVLGHLWYFKKRLLANQLQYVGVIVSSLGFLWAGLSGQTLSLEISGDHPVLQQIGPIGLQWDFLSGLVATAILTIGAAVLSYSNRYLDDDPKKQDFMKNTSLLLSCVLVFTLSSNLVLLGFMWLLTSFFLHRLLVHFPERVEARRAAAEKFWVSRTGDVFLVIFLMLVHQLFGGFHIPSIFLELQGQDLSNTSLLTVAGVFLVLGAATKSAQMPFHFWLPKTMETPTPVSALMHAGVINAGGYLVIRMSPLLIQAPVALTLLAWMGAITCALASVMMLVQTDIKKSLAYSTIAQMGFMMLQCGLAVFGMATLHLVGHAFYKAYAFLSSGTVVQLSQLQRYYPEQSRRDQIRSASAMVVLSALLVSACVATGLIPMAYGVLVFILALALSQMILESGTALRGVAIATVAGAAYFALGATMDSWLGTSVPTEFQGSLGRRLALLGIPVLFVAVFFLQNFKNRLEGHRLGQWLYVQLMVRT